MPALEEDISKNEIIVTKLLNFSNIIREIDSKNPNFTNQYSLLEEVEANSKLLRQIMVSNELHRDLHENEIKWLNIGISVETVEQFLIFTKMDPTQQKFFVGNINGLEYSVDKGLNIEKLFSMDFEQQKLFIEPYRYI